MSLKIISLDSFTRDVKKLYKKYGKLPNDLRVLEETLTQNPKAGIAMSIGLYKLRLKNSSATSGKSGGFRVIYYYLDKDENVYLMKIYSKSEIENISEDRLLEIWEANRPN